MHDLVIRGGLVVDGSGGKPFRADVAVDEGLIAVVGKVSGPGKEEVEASGHIVTPGFVDLHTHYDAQVMWDPILAPSAWHGVTTVITGNCSVGFAPLRSDDRSFLLKVMEAVEEIPCDVMEAGIDFDWETYPEYLDALDRRHHTIDIGTQVAHVALRAYVMGDRAERNEQATAHDIEVMSELAEQALRAGALGLAGTRTKAHRYVDGTMVPGTFAYEDELLQLSRVVGKVEGRVMQYLGNIFDLDHDIPYTLELARAAKAPIHFIMSDTAWERRLSLIDAGRKEGLTFYGHVAPRAVGLLGHWRSVEHPFSEAPTMKAVAELTWEDRLTRLREPAFRAKVIAETAALEDSFFTHHPFALMYEMSAYPDYEPDPKTDSIAARAEQKGQPPLDYAYDVMTRNEGSGFLYVPIANYRSGDFSVIRTLLTTPNIVVSLADGGAHCTRICDAATPTFMLAHWGRDRTRGEKLPLETVVRSLTRDPAASYGLFDRGLLREGYLADINVIDFENLRLPGPYRAFDFPTGGQRLLQQAEGYVATIKRGRITFRDGQHCGTFPGQVIRGSQPEPRQSVSAEPLTSSSKANERSRHT
jgi:N-acyl-D-amino-acid deacylase